MILYLFFIMVDSFIYDAKGNDYNFLIVELSDGGKKASIESAGKGR